MSEKISVRNVNEIKNKIEELEIRIQPKIRYDINNKEIKEFSIENIITQAKIDVLKWCLLKKRVI